MDSSNLADIIFFAALAGFLIYRLRSVLGRKDLSNDIKTNNFSRLKDGLADRLKKPVKDAGVSPLDNKPLPVYNTEVILEPKIEDSQVAAIVDNFKNIDRSFSVGQFLNGAKYAFEIILNAFAKGDKDTLASLLSKEVYDEFVSEIDARNASGLKHEVTLAEVISCDIIDAKLSDRTAFVTVKVMSDQIDVTRNDKGEIVEGSASQAILVKDVWTFSRDLSSQNPNWRLVQIASGGAE